MELDKQIVAGFAEALGTEPSAALERYVREGTSPPESETQLVAWAANSIHGFVFDTTNAMAIRGASDLLVSLDKSLREGKDLGLAREQVLYAGGGSGLAVVGKKQSLDVVARLHRRFAEATLIATCSAGSVDLVAGRERFGERVQATGRCLARNRALSGSDAEPAVHFFFERCAVCGRRAANIDEPSRMSGPRKECQPCHRSINLGRKILGTGDELRDFSHIADDNGYIGVVYADGNGIGKTIRDLPSPLSYATFSEAMEHLVRDSFAAVAKEYELKSADNAPGRETRDAHGRYQLPICGGDDLVAIVPGELAVPFTRDLLAHLEEKADQSPAIPTELGAAAGIALGKASFPIRHLVAEAESLLKIAKQRVYRDQVRSALTFAVVRDGSPRSEPHAVENRRTEGGSEDTAGSGATGIMVLSTGRPYSLREVQQVFTPRFRAFQSAEIGRSQLFALRRRAAAGAAQLRNHVLYQIGRSSHWRKLVAELAGDEAAVHDAAGCERLFTPQYDHRRVFDIADMIELHRLWKEPKPPEAHDS